MQFNQLIKKNILFLTSAVLTITLVGFILFLVAQVTGFSTKVTDFYAPTIFAVRDFSSAAHHVQLGADKQDGGTVHHMYDIPAMEKESKWDPALYHLKTATELIRNLADLWPREHWHKMENMVLRAEKIIAASAKDGLINSAVKEDITWLREATAAHVKTHDQELIDARDGINNSAFFIRLVTFLVFGVGIFLSFRELRFQRLKEFEKEQVAAITALASALDARDPYTSGHSERVAHYSVLTAREMGLSSVKCDHIRLAALMHDIGKIAVPDAVLRKEGKLDDAEWQEMRQHPAMTGKILEPFGSLSHIRPWALYHHERPDGKGYPEGLSIETIPLEAQVLAIADAFDAMTSDRPYRPGMDIDKATMEIEKHQGKQWRTDVVNAFLKGVKKGTIVIKKD